MYQQNKPLGAPACWSYQFTDGDPECMQCPHKDSCRPACITKLSSAPFNVPLPVSQMVPMSQVTAQPVPMPYRPANSQPVAVPYRPMVPPPVPQPSTFRPGYIAPPVVQYQNQQPVVQYQQPAPVVQYQYQQPVVQYQQQYQQPVAQYQQISNPYTPNPNMPMMRPGAAGPAYYFCQYPEESVPARLVKNIVLRGAESIFGELMFFFRHWTWPPRA